MTRRGTLGAWWRRWLGHRQGEDVESLRRRYEHFQHLIDGNNRVLELIADAGDKAEGEYLFDRRYLESLVTELEDAVSSVVFDLNAMSGARYVDLVDAFERLRKRTRAALSPARVVESELVLPLGRVGADLADSVGDKMAALGELRNRLGLPVPEGVVVSAWACRRHFKARGLDAAIATQAERLAHTPEAVDEVAATLQRLVRSTPVERGVANAIRRAVRRAEWARFGLAVRSSAPGEGAVHSFAGQHETLLNVRAADAVDAYREVVASLFSRKALLYRMERRLPIGDALMAVGLLAMQSARASGVLHTVDPSAPDRDVMMVAAAPGLGPSVAQGNSPVDRFELSREACPRILSTKLARKHSQLVAREAGGTERVPLEAAATEGACLSEAELFALGRMASRIERHAGRHQEIEWAVDAEGHVVLLQARGLSLARSPAGERAVVASLARLRARQAVLLSGTGVIACRGVGAGPVVNLYTAEDVRDFPQGAVLVAQNASPRYAPLLPLASAVVTSVGSSTGHLAAVARELRVPMLVDVEGADLLSDGMEVTVDAEENVVYPGVLQELVRFHLSRAPQDVEFEEFRVLRRLLREIAPLNLTDAENEGFRAGSCSTYHDVIRFAHEMAVRELLETPGLRPRDRRRFVRRLDLVLPIDLDLLDLGGGLEPGVGDARLAPAAVRSSPLAALLEGLTAPGTWRTDPVDLDMQSLLSSATRFGALDSPHVGRVRPNLAVITRDYLNLHLFLGYHFNMIDCRLSEDAETNYVYFRFHGGVTDITRRSRRARVVALILQEYDFAVETKGDLIVGRLRNLPQQAMAERLEMIGRLIGFSRQLDVLMRDDATVLERAREFVGHQPAGLPGTLLAGVGRS